MTNVVIIDDEPLLLKVMGKMLKTMGFSISPFQEPDKAIDFISNNSESCSLIILDKNMPGISGIEIAESLRNSGVTTPILLSTGESDLNEFEDELFTLFNGIIQKPFQKQQLEDIITTILDEQSA